MKYHTNSNAKGSFLVEFLVSLSLFSIIAFGLSNQLIAHSRFFKSAETAKTEISTNQDIIKVYIWFRGSVDHPEALTKTTLIFEEDFSITCSEDPGSDCILHRNDKNIGFSI